MGTSRIRPTVRDRSAADLASFTGSGPRVVVAALLAAATLTLSTTAPASWRGAPQGAEPTTGADEPPVVEVDRFYRLTVDVPGTPEAAFEAWTVADRFVEWFPDWAEMTVAVGESYRMGWEGYDAVWEGTYEEIDPPATLVFTWTPPRSVYPEGAYPTTVRLTFDEADGGTRITMEHSGFRDGGQMEPVLEAWRSYLFNLRAYLFQVAASEEESSGR